MTFFLSIGLLWYFVGMIVMAVMRRTDECASGACGHDTCAILTRRGYPLWGYLLGSTFWPLLVLVMIAMTVGAFLGRILSIRI